MVKNQIFASTMAAMAFLLSCLPAQYFGHGGGVVVMAGQAEMLVIVNVVAARGGMARAAKWHRRAAFLSSFRRVEAASLKMSRIWRRRLRRREPWRLARWPM